LLQRFLAPLQGAVQGAVETLLPGMERGWNQETKGDGKIIGKPWENHRKWMFTLW